MSGFRAPTAGAEAALRELGSRFFARIGPARSSAEARAFVAELERSYPDATHVCFAWRIGWPASERAADAGEPAGTAGAPILSALRGAGLSNVVAAVVRYFGGTKLGKGGLVRAYGGVVRRALAELETCAVEPTTRFEIRCAYERIGALKRLLRSGRIELVGEEYGAEARLSFAVVTAATAAFLEQVAALGVEAVEQSEPG